MELFICQYGMHRSRTGAELFKGRYAGIKSEDNPVTKELLRKAETIYVMEPHQEEYLKNNYAEEIKNKKIHCLNITNFYAYNDPELIKILQEKLREIKR